MRTSGVIALDAEDLWNKGSIAKMEDIEKVMSWLEGLTQDNWREFHSDSEVQNIAKYALELLKELQRNPVIVCPHCGKRVN